MPSQIKGHSRKTELRIGSFEVFTTYFLGHFLSQINVPQFELHEFTPGRLEDAIGDGRIDIGITYHPISKPDIRFTEVTKIRMGVYGNAAFLNTELTEMPFVIPNDLIQGTPSKVMGLDGWPDHLFPRHVAFKVTMMESALELCRRGKSVAYLPDFVVRLHNSQVKKEFALKELDCPIPKTVRQQSVFVVQANTEVETPFARPLAKALRSLG
jgi:DNA-binding transcriptional LysR family regulator